MTCTCCFEEELGCLEMFLFEWFFGFDFVEHSAEALCSEEYIMSISCEEGTVGCRRFRRLFCQEYFGIKVISFAFGVLGTSQFP